MEKEKKIEYVSIGEYRIIGEATYELAFGVDVDSVFLENCKRRLNVTGVNLRDMIDCSIALFENKSTPSMYKRVEVRGWKKEMSLKQFLERVFKESAYDEGAYDTEYVEMTKEIVTYEKDK